MATIERPEVLHIREKVDAFAESRRMGFVSKNDACTAATIMKIREERMWSRESEISAEMATFSSIKTVGDWRHVSMQRYYGDC
jgi:hypothetical protein